MDEESPRSLVAWSSELAHGRTQRGWARLGNSALVMFGTEPLEVVDPEWHGAISCTTESGGHWWIGTDAGEIAYLQGERLSITPAKTAEPITSIVETTEAIWILTKSGRPFVRRRKRQPGRR